MNLKSFHHVCIQTDRYQDSLRFYRDVLGFRIVAETANFHGRAFNTWLEGSGILIELQTGKSGSAMHDWDPQNQGPVHLCFLVDDVTKAFEGLKSQGFTKFKKKESGEELYRVNNVPLFKMCAPEGTEIEIRDAAIEC